MKCFLNSSFKKFCYSNVYFSQHWCDSTLVVQYLAYNVKKGLPFSRPQLGCHWPNSPWTGKIWLFPLRESLVSDIPAGDRKIVNLFLHCRIPPLSSKLKLRVQSPSRARGQESNRGPTLRQAVSFTTLYTTPQQLGLTLVHHIPVIYATPQSDAIHPDCYVTHLVYISYIQCQQLRS
jgi:hypothetical protein